MPQLAATLDIGTSSVRASLFSASGRRVRSVRASTTDCFIENGLSMDAHTLLRIVLESLASICESLKIGERIAAVGVASFWHSLLGIGADGEPTTPLYLWFDNRSARDAQRLRETLGEATLHGRTGCRLHPSYWPSKLMWLSRQHAQFGRIRRWVSFTDWLFYRLGGGWRCSTAMAAATGLFDQRAKTWDEVLIGELPIEQEQLPVICDEPVALETLAAPRLRPLLNASWMQPTGDGYAGTIGCGAATEDILAINLGTSAAVRMLVSADRAYRLPESLWNYRIDGTTRLVGAALSDCGNLIAWLRSNLRLPTGRSLDRLLLKDDPCTESIEVRPAWWGERFPDWSPEATGAIRGLTGAATSVAIMRSALWAIAGQVSDAVSRLRQSGAHADEIIVSGGAASTAFTQMIADKLGRSVAVCQDREATSRGAALLALRQADLINGFDSFPANITRVSPRTALPASLRTSPDPHDEEHHHE